MRRRSVVAALLAVWFSTPLALQAQESLREAQDALRTGRYDDSIDRFARVTRTEPASVAAARGLVTALMEVGRYDDAIQAAREFGRRNRGSVELANLLGQALAATGKLDDAEAAFGRAADASDSLIAKLHLAALQNSRGQVDSAMLEFDRFIDVYNQGGALSSEELTAVAAAVRFLGANDPALFRDALRAYDEAIAADRANLEPRIQLGEMFLQKYNGADARATFEEILSLNPRNPRALLGAARTRRFNGEPEAMELAEQSLEVNPNLVAALVFKATLHLELEDHQRADVAIDHALAVNPTSLEALSTRAASQFLRRDDAGYRETVQRVLALNPKYGGLYNTLAEVSARNRLYEQAAEFAQRAVDLDETSWRGWALLGINQLRNGQIAAGRRNLEVAFEGDPYDVWTKNTLDLLDTLQQYPVATSPRFEFVIDGNESSLLSLYFVQLAEEAYSRLAADYGFRPETPIRIEVFPDHADFSVRTVGLVGLGALGVSFGPVVAMDSPSARDIGEFNWGSTFWHELAHTFHLELSDHRVPRWFTEGLAVYEERRARSGWGNRLTPGFLTAFREGQVLPVSQLNNGFMRPSYPGQLQHAYYQASLVCELIERESGYAALVEMLRGYALGKSTEALFAAVVGMSTDQFDDLFAEFLADKFADVRAVFPGVEPGRSAGYHSREQVERRAMMNRDDYLAQLAMGRTLVQEGDLAAAVDYLERAKSLFPDYAEGDGPYWYLARVFKDRGELDRAAAELATMTALNERHYESRVELAELRLALNDKEGAARALEESLFIHPFDPALHERLAGLYADVAEWQSAIRERRAVVALAPVDIAEALYQLAKAYYDSGDLDGARLTVLRALEDAPNFEKAQTLLLEIHARRGGTNP